MKEKGEKRMYIEWLDWSFSLPSILDAFIKMTMALICGGVIGMERGRKKRPAGFRTYMLVCLGATLVMMTNDFLCENGHGVDVARLGAQVINGIGFLGAGTIITTGHNRVKGLTTAAGLWAAACIGLAIGSGYYEGAVIGTLMIVVIMVVLHTFDRRLVANTKILMLYVEYKKMSALRRLNAFARENQIIIDDVEFETPDPTKTSKSAAVVSIRLPGKSSHAELIEKIMELEGILYVEEL